MYAWCIEVTFEELLDLARAEDAAQKPQAAASNDNTLSVSASHSSSGGGYNTTVALAETLPPGSDSRRAAVAALGNEIHTRLLRNNCVTSAAVLAASLLPAAVVGECEEHSDTVRTCPLLSFHRAFPFPPFPYISILRSCTSCVVEHCAGLLSSLMLLY